MDPDRVQPDREARRPWAAKFGDCFRGIRIAARGQSFRIQVVAAAAVVLVAALLRLPPVDWAILIVCIAVVLAAETFNTSLEQLARAITTEHNEHIGRALDLAAAAVLVTAIGAAVTGSVVVLNRLL